MSSITFTRKVGQVIHISNDIEIKVVQIDSRSVKINIKAPRAIPIARGEIYTGFSSCIDGG